MFKTYPETLHYLYANLPIFQRVGAAAYKADLTNTIKLCTFLDNPQNQFKSIHIAGTNGKGSTSHMLASILQSTGYKTGLYTSPHLKEFTERIRVNGIEADKDFVVDFVNRIQPSIDIINPSFFEITVAMAFDYFARQKVDVAVIEVGLGGRLDSTNVITPALSVITNIGWDHMDILGDTLQKIAHEKAGIIKHKIPVVISERQTEVEDVFVAKAKQEMSPIVFATDDLEVQTLSGDAATFSVYKNGHLSIDRLSLPLQGFYQQKNLPGVLKSVEILNDMGFSISNHAVMNGLKNVIINTNLKGRWQILGEKPLIVCDTAHNVDGVIEVVRQIRAQHFNQLHFVLGMVKDKDISKVLSLLPKEGKYYFCQAKIPRALNAEELKEKAAAFSLNGTIIPDVNDAIRAAKAGAHPGDFIFIGGSTFVVAEIDNL